MAYEKPESHSENYKLQDEWEALELIGEITVLPVEILSEFVEDSWAF